MLITGATRIPVERYIECIENYKKQFSWVGDFDIWYFTWKTPGGAEEKLRPFVSHFYAPEPSPTDAQMDELGIPYVQQLNASPEHRICRISHYAMVYGMSYLFDRIKESGQDYDYACRIRNDLFFEEDSHDTKAWKDLSEAESNAYVTLGVIWCGTSDSMASDHVGLTRFENMQRMWSFDLDRFKSEIPQCWNFEAYVHKRLVETGLVHRTFNVRRYIIRRASPELDWNIR